LESSAWLHEGSALDAGTAARRRSLSDFAVFPAIPMNKVSTFGLFQRNSMTR
jgi:hypothetical protein